MISLEPIFLQNPSSQRVAQGHLAILQCKAIASQSVTEIRWFKNDREILRVFNDSGVAVLKLLNISISDAGNYHCYAQNEFGNATSTTATIAVLCKCDIMKKYICHMNCNDFKTYSK